jgi:hypothetical protein
MVLYANGQRSLRRGVTSMFISKVNEYIMQDTILNKLHSEPIAAG